MAEENEAEIVDLRDIPATEPARLGRIDKLVVYQVGPFRRYMVRIPGEQFTEKTLMDAVRADWESRKGWIGKKVSL